MTERDGAQLRVDAGGQNEQTSGIHTNLRSHSGAGVQSDGDVDIPFRRVRVVDHRWGTPLRESRDGVTTRSC